MFSCSIWRNMATYPPSIQEILSGDTPCIVRWYPLYCQVIPRVLSGDTLCIVRWYPVYCQVIPRVLSGDTPCVVRWYPLYCQVIPPVLSGGPVFCQVIYRVLGHFLHRHYQHLIDWHIAYIDNQIPMESEDDIIAILNCIWWCYKANGFTRHL